MGEQLEMVHMTGAPALDVAARKAQEYGELLAASGLEFSPLRRAFPVLVLHPSSPDDRLEEQRALSVIRALKKAFPHGPIYTIGPNNDPGHRGILRAYERERKHLALNMSLQQDEFWCALAASGILVGNSSSGIIEASTFGCAVVNMGDRQAGRERSGNVIDVPWEGKDGGVMGLERALRRVMTDKAFARRVALRKNVYGDGRAAERIVTVLEGIAREGISTVKRFCD